MMASAKSVTLAKPAAENRFPSNNFRVTAFADVLGWGELTAGIDQLIARKILHSQPLSIAERETVDEFENRIERARGLDQHVRQILRELREFAIPNGDVIGDSGPRHFFSNQHVTFVRFSDNVFLHSTSFQWIVQFLAELFKRGLERGILFRAGISAGSVFHEEPTLPELDARSRDVSLFGDAITTAVAAESAGKGRGARVLVHPQLQGLLRDDYSPVLQPIDGCPSGIKNELCWWMDFRKTWPGSSVNESLPVRKNWREMARDRLKSHPDFEWNRASCQGARVVEDTIRALSDGHDSLPPERSSDREVLDED